MRDLALLESVLARPINRWFYGENDAAVLAAAFAFGIARNHPFIDGNKRTASVLSRLFLDLNGHKLVSSKEDSIRTVLALAAGELYEAALAAWFREHLASG